MKTLLLHLPLIGLLLTIGLIAAVNEGWLPWMRTEATYGWMVVVWYPLAALLGLTQVVLWIGWILRRGPR